MIRRSAQHGVYSDIVDEIDKRSGVKTDEVPKGEPAATLYWIRNATDSEIGVGDNVYLARVYYYRQLLKKYGVAIGVNSNHTGREMKALSWAKKNICNKLGRTVIEVIDAFLETSTAFITEHRHDLIYLPTMAEEIMTILKRSCHSQSSSVRAVLAKIAGGK